MPTPLPGPYVPDYGRTIDAYRSGREDFLQRQKQSLLQEAGGLAAAGNMPGARNKLYSGGEFGEARGVSADMRADAAEKRAIQSHAQSLDDAKLAKALKSQELLGNMGQAILKHANPAQALEQVKARLRAAGLNADSVTLDQLPVLMQQNVSVQQAFQNELEERRLRNQEAEALRVQSNVDRSFANTVEQQQLAQRNKEHDYLIGREDKAYERDIKEREMSATADFRKLQQQVLLQRAQAAAAKASAPKPLTSDQSTARNFLGVMEDATDTLRGSDKQPGILAKDDSESPMGHSSNFLAMKAPDSILTSGHLDKKQKQYIQGAMQWVRAKLRKESGASISPDEFAADYRVFFPQPGDDIQTRRNKAKARKRVEDGFRTMGGFDAPGAPDANPSAADMSDEDLSALFQ